MPFKEKCPVCRIGYRVRPDVKTCSRQCAKEWAQWTPEQRHTASLAVDPQYQAMMVDVKQAFNPSVPIAPDEPITEDEDTGGSRLLSILGEDDKDDNNKS